MQGQPQSASQRSLCKALRGVLDGLLRHEHPLGEESTAARLRLGPDCDEGLNVGRVSDADWAAALGPGAARAFSLPGLLESIEASADGVEAAVPKGLLTKPLPYQRQGVGWMLQREALAGDGASTSATDLPPPPPRLDPAYEQLVAADGQLLYAHRTLGHADATMTLARRGGSGEQPVSANC